jgi:hypothetical protein
MSIAIVMSQNSTAENSPLRVGRSSGTAGRKQEAGGTPESLRSFLGCNVAGWRPIVNAAKDSKDGAPPPVFSGPPRRSLERKLKLNPKDRNAKADVGSDLSMDASDPSAATQPGSSEDPAPSSGFPE